MITLSHKARMQNQPQAHNHPATTNDNFLFHHTVISVPTTKLSFAMPGSKDQDWRPKPQNRRSEPVIWSNTKTYRADVLQGRPGRLETRHQGGRPVVRS